MSKPLSSDHIQQHILLIRGQKVMLDSDLAELYEVTTRALNQAVKRNIGRFPADFMFQLNYQEVRISRSQIVTLKRGQNIKYLPHAFTEQGVAMLSSVLRSERAIQVNVEIMRTFVRLREMIASHKDLARRLSELEMKYDAQFKSVFDAIRQLMAPSVFTRPPRGCQDSLFSRPPHRRIGFGQEGSK